MGGLSIALLVSLLAAAPVADTVPGETVLILGRVRMVQRVDGERSHIASRKFEVVFRRRNGKTVAAQACLYADLNDDQDWDGGCFPLSLLPDDESIPLRAVADQEMTPVDAPAQRLLRMLAAAAAAALPQGRTVIGFDPGVPFTVQAERFLEADL